MAKGSVRTPVQRLLTAMRKSGSSHSGSTGVTTTMYTVPASCTPTSPAGEHEDEVAIRSSFPHCCGCAAFLIGLEASVFDEQLNRLYVKF